MTCVFTTYSRYLDTYVRAWPVMGQPGHLDPETTWFNGVCSSLLKC